MIPKTNKTNKNAKNKTIPNQLQYQQYMAVYFVLFSYNIKHKLQLYYIHNMLIIYLFKLILIKLV